MADPVESNPDYTYADALLPGLQRGRGAGLNPGNRFESVRLHVLGEHLDQQQQQAPEPVFGEGGRPMQLQTSVPTQVLPDQTRSILNHIDSPDIGYGWSLNPYRGCEHGCIYCFARPGHEMLGLSSGLDFETRIFAKHDAPKLLRQELARPSWKADPIMLSGVTDCYQPIEADLRITRQCLAVMAQCRQPVSVITKNKLVTRDLDLLQELHRFNAVRVAISVTTLDNRLASQLEPRASAPGERIEAIRQLSAAGIPVVAMVAPIVPGITDREVPAILERVAQAGAQSAGYVLLRLPYQVKGLFLDWLQRNFPLRARHVESLIRQMRGGDLYDSQFGSRMKGEGPMAQQIGGMFKLFARRLGLDKPMEALSGQAFARPERPGQMRLF